METTLYSHLISFISWSAVLFDILKGEKIPLHNFIIYLNHFRNTEKRGEAGSLSEF